MLWTFIVHLKLFFYVFRFHCDIYIIQPKFLNCFYIIYTHFAIYKHFYPLISILSTSLIQYILGWPKIPKRFLIDSTVIYNAAGPVGTHLFQLSLSCSDNCYREVCQHISIRMFQSNKETGYWIVP